MMLLGFKILDSAAKPRRVWEIDNRLSVLVGHPIRVRVDLFQPRLSNGELIKHAIEARNFVLPDGTCAAGEPMFAEGILKKFERRIAVVYIDLERLSLKNVGEGRVNFRGRTAVIVQAPALVRVAHPFSVERIPTTEQAYWNHLCSIDGQFDLDLK